MIDLAKGIGIILVIIGHCKFCPPWLKHWFYYFHMPLFFFLSGMTFKKVDSFRRFLIKKIRSLVVPYFCLSLVIWVWKSIIRQPDHFMNINTLKDLLRMVVAWRTTPYYFTLWFVTCVFSAEIVFFWIVKLLKNKNGKILYWLVLVSLSVAGHFILKYYKQALPWAVDMVPTILLFVGAGYWYQNISGRTWCKEQFENKRTLLLLPVLLGLSIVIARSEPKIIDLYNSYTGGYFAFTIGAFIGIAMVLIICSLLKDNRMIEFIGRNSLVYYAGQKAVFLPVTNTMAASIAGTIKILDHASIKTAISVVLTCCGLAICSVCINKCFPFLIGKKQTQMSKLSNNT